MQPPDHDNYRNKSDASEAQRQALSAVIKALRRLNEQSVLLNTDARSLEMIAAGIRDIEAQMRAHGGSRMLEYFRMGFLEDVSDGMLPYSPTGGSHNPVTAPAHYRKEGARLLAEITFGIAHEGPPHSAHGGIVSGIYDQVMAATCTLNQRAGPTASMTVNYLKATPLYKPLTFSSWIDRTEAKKTFVKSECTCEGETLTTAEGLFILMRRPGG